MVHQVKDNQVQDLTKVHHITKGHNNGIKTTINRIRTIDSHTAVQVDLVAFLVWVDHSRIAALRESVIQDCSNKISNQDKTKVNLNQRSSHKTHLHKHL